MAESAGWISRDNIKRFRTSKLIHQALRTSVLKANTLKPSNLIPELSPKTLNEPPKQQTYVEPLKGTLEA